jgi:type VI secretion system protein VasJ
MATTPFSELGSAPIPGMSPSGAEVRDQPLFDQLESEVAKLANPVNSPLLDWGKVNEWATELLASKGKDLMVGCYLAGGLLETRGLPGLADGLQVIADMVQTYWDSLFPPLKRMRGRRNAMQWLIDRVQQRAIDLNWSEIEPQNEELVARLVAAVGAIDAVLMEKDADAPSLRSTLALVKSLPVIQEFAPASDNATRVKESGAGGAVPSESIESLDQALKGLERCSSRLQAIAQWLLAEDMSNPLAYRLNRQAAWMSFVELPPAQTDETSLPPPITQLMEALDRLRAAGSHRELVEFAETQLAEFPLWLDLNFICFEALGEMPEEFGTARREVASATAGFAMQLPGLEKLLFAGGTPFASTQTLNWLASLSANSAAGEQCSASPMNPERQAVLTAIREAKAFASNDDLMSAVESIQTQLSKTVAASEKLTLRIRLCELLSEHRPGAAVAPFAHNLIDCVAKYKLQAWDPPLALDALKVAYAVLFRTEDNAMSAASVLGLIAEIDLSEATRLVTQ